MYKILLDKRMCVVYNANTFANQTTSFGLVLVSTGVLKLRKPSAGRDRVTIRILKLNANENLAYAA